MFNLINSALRTKSLPLLVCFIMMTAVFGCSGETSSTEADDSGSSSSPPVLNNLAIEATDFDSITLAMPTLSKEGNPAPTVNAYIGINGTISASGSEVSDYDEGPVDVSLSGYQFSLLSPFTEYKIIVVAVNSAGYSVKQIVQSTAGIAPVMNDLSVGAVDSASITLNQPTFSTAGNPAPTVNAYLGLDGVISVAGNVVSNSTEGPVDVSSVSYPFTSLSTNTNYRIIVVAENVEGYSVKQIAQGTAATAPVLNNLSVNSFDTVSITINQPTFSTSGNPVPTVNAYIGVDGTISVSGKVVSDSTEGPVDVSSGSYQFQSLDPYSNYRIIVVAENVEGYSVEQIAQSTQGIAPVLNNLSINTFDSESITIDQPTLSTAGNPAPTVNAYIGIDGTISVSGKVVSDSTEGPVDVSSGSYQFQSLGVYTNYRIIVVAENVEGYSVKEIAQSTQGIAPVLNNLSINTFDTVSITIDQPSLSTAGNPTPTVNAYIGVDGTISVSGKVVSDSTEGPVDVSSGSYQFQSLDPYTNYRIIVVAENVQGYSVEEIAQSTEGIAPVLNNISINTFDSESITVDQPTLSTAGNPTPAVNAYIGIDGTISVSGKVVSDSTEGPIDVSSGSYQFQSLDSYSNYRIIVVAENVEGYSVKEIAQSTQGIAPVLNDLSINTFDSESISIDQPTLSISGNPTPAVNAYIGIDGTISVSGKVVSNSTEGPVDVSSGSYQFQSLGSYTNYRIIVVSDNVEGYSVKQIVQTSGGPPVLNNLSINTFDSVSITVDQPSFSTAGNPSPTVNAYIGVDGTISVSGKVVTNSTEGPIDVSSGSYQFQTLDPYSNYRIMVVAENVEGYSVKEIAQSTQGIAPVLNNLSINTFDSESITIDQPSLSTAGNPTPTVNAYIGVDGTISVSGKVVSDSTEGPVDVSSGSYQFQSLGSNTNYRIIVVAENAEGFSVKQIAQTSGGPPVLNALSLSGYDSSSITLEQPTFSIAGNPLPTVNAYIGIDGTISVTDNVVSNSLEGPIDVSSGSYQFSGLEGITNYKIIVVAENTEGFSVENITQGLAGSRVIDTVGVFRPNDSDNWHTISIKVISNTIYIAYYDSLSKDLKFAKSTDGGSSWIYRTVDSTGDVGKYPSIAVDGNNVYISYDDDSNNDLKFAKSTDGGDTWPSGLMRLPRGTGSGMNIKIETDGSGLGKIYLIFSTPNRYFVKSTDFGDTWSTPLLIADCYNESGSFNGQYVNTLKKYLNNIYVLYMYQTPGGIYDTYLRFVRSIDDGETFSSYKTVETRDEVGSDNVMDVDDFGYLHIFYNYNNTLIYKRSNSGMGSSDVGNTWTTPVTLYPGGEYAGGTSIATSGDNVYCAYRIMKEVVWRAEYESSIRFVKSTDGGLNWGSTKTIQINPISTVEIYWQYCAEIFFIQLAVDGNNVYVCYYDNSGAGTIKLLKSVDAGETW